MQKSEEILETILENLIITDIEKKDIIDSHGYVIAEDIFANDNIPPFNNSTKDGFAVRYDDIKKSDPEKTVELKIIDEQPAGFVSGKQVIPGTAIKVMTGAMIPDGADTVVQYELTVSYNGYVQIKQPPGKGANIRLAGNDVQIGEKVIGKGTSLNSSHIGILASLGLSEIEVYRKPVVAVLSTGSELIPIHEELKPGKIRDSNSYMIYALVLEAGAEPKKLTPVMDDFENISQLIQHAMHYCDAIIITGGVAGGDFDFLQNVVDSLGGKHSSRKIYRKSGKPLIFGKLNDKPVFGLPGKPDAARICFDEYVKPALLKMMGRHKFN